LESELVDDPIYGSLADTKVALSEFLSDDFGACVWIQEPVTDDLTNKFLCSPVFGFGASFRAQESLAALFKKQGSDLEIALTAETKFSGDAVNPFRSAFAVNEHGQFSGDFIGIGNGKRSGFTLDVHFGKLERNHGGFSLGDCSAKYCLINYGTMLF
jgi:hypothetical protein